MQEFTSTGKLVIMDAHAHDQRSESLRQALDRISAERSDRREKAGMFQFSERAREAARQRAERIHAERMERLDLD